MTDDKRITWSVKEAATALGTSQRSIRRALQYGQIGGIKIGRAWRIPRQDIEERMEMNRRRLDILSQWKRQSVDKR